MQAMRHGSMLMPGMGMAAVPVGLGLKADGWVAAQAWMVRGIMLSQALQLQL